MRICPAAQLSRPVLSPGAQTTRSDRCSDSSFLSPMTPRSQATSNQPATTQASVGFLQPNRFIRPIFPLYLAARLLR